MDTKESIQQIETLIEAWQLDEADLNQTDINAMQALLKENQELKKQLEERNIEYFKGAYDTHDKYYTQQKEFIKYLEDYINSLKKEYGNYVNDNYSEEYGRYYTAKEILQKYEEIIGDVKNEN